MLSFESIPEIRFNMNAVSFTVLVRGPICSILFAYEIKPYLLIKPYVGLYPTVEQKLAGFLTEPPVSEPSDATHSNALTETALPPDEPPGTCSTFQGFLLGPYALNSVVRPIANSSMLALPTNIASCCFSFVITVASYGAIKFSSIFDAHVVFESLIQMLSLIEIGIPKQSPTFSPDFIFLSIFLA